MATLARRAVVQARRFGVEILSAEATAIRLDGPYRFLKLADGAELSCHALLVATGVQWRKLDAPGVERLTGAGIYYGAAMTEAMSTRDEDVFIVGGANSAGQAAMYFSKYARRVVMLVRGSSLAASMSQYLINQLKETTNVQIEFDSSVVEAHGQDHLEAISVHCTVSNEVNKVPANSLFIMIGAAPNTKWLADIVERDERGFILSGPDLMRDGKRPKGWQAGPRSGPFGNERAGYLCSRRCATWFGQASRVGGRRRLCRDLIRTSISQQGGVTDGRHKNRRRGRAGASVRGS